jgi:hypothetical protein
LDKKEREKTIILDLAKDYESVTSTGSIIVRRPVQKKSKEVISKPDTNSDDSDTDSDSNGAI